MTWPVPPSTTIQTAPGTVAAVLVGRLPAEALPTTDDRNRLITLLHHRGWTDTQIAAHTRWSTYTVARIRGRLHLPANPAHHQEVG